MLVSRPRRFGKTVDANMAASFFKIGSDKELFHALNIGKNETICHQHQGKYNVIKIDMSKGIMEHDSIKPFIHEIVSDILCELKAYFPEMDIENEKRLFKALEYSLMS